jgi:hypothetical protein
MPSHVKMTNLLIEGLRAIGFTTELGQGEHYFSVVETDGKHYLHLPYISPRQSGALCLLDI